MELGEFKIPGYEEYENPPKPGQAIVLVPEKQPPLPNANTIEGMIQGIGLVAAAGARKRRNSRTARWVTLLLLCVFAGPALIELILTFF